jgi:aspartate kinase
MSISNQLTVEKIGGTSMSRFADVLKNIILYNRAGDSLYNRIFVVSAYSNVTNWLLEHKKTGEPGVYVKFIERDDYSTALDALCKQLLDINKTFQEIGLDLKAARAFITERIAQAKNILHSLSNVMASGYVDIYDIHLAAREILASIGEAHSAWNSVNILNNNGISARYVDLCGFDDTQHYTIDERIQASFQGIDFSSQLCVATGYAKGTEGIMRAFDRGYSEVTFSKIAVLLQASEAVIHKEYHLASADPNIVGVENAVPVGHTNFIIADQLADIGMEAIHPKAAKPLELAGINIRIKNTFDPEHPGTLISKDYTSEQPKVELVSGSPKMLAVEVHDPMMVGEVGFDLRIMQVFEKHKISYILKSTNANSITTVVWDDYRSRKMIDELHSVFYRVVVERVALVCVMGTNINKPGFLAKAAMALYHKDINIMSIAQSLRQVNMQFVISRHQYKDAIVELNREMCLQNR